MLSSGPPFSDAQDPPTNLLGDGIDPGAIAGIGVAGAVIVIGLILLAIYCCIRARGDAMKDQNYPPGDGNAESSVYTTGILLNPINILISRFYSSLNQIVLPCFVCLVL